MSLKSNYDISSNAGDFSAEKNFFSLSDKVKIYDESGKLVAKIQSYYHIFKVKHDFILNDKVFHFRTEKFWKGVFSCKCDGEEYKLLRHKRNDYSVFKEDIQIASFNKGAISFGKGDVYNAKANSSVNLPLILCMILSVDITENEDSNDSASISFDFGNIGPEEKPFDFLWKPSE